MPESKILSFDLDELLTSEDKLDAIFEIKLNGAMQPLYPLKHLPEKYYMRYKAAQAQEAQLLKEFYSQISPEDLSAAFDAQATAKIAQADHKKGETVSTLEFLKDPYKAKDKFVVKGDDTTYTITEVDGNTVMFEPEAVTDFADQSFVVLAVDLANIDIATSSMTIADLPKVEAGTIVPRRHQLEAVFRLNPNALAQYPPFGLRALYRQVKPLLSEGEEEIAKDEQAEAEAEPEQPQAIEGKDSDPLSKPNTGLEPSETLSPNLEQSTVLAEALS